MLGLGIGYSFFVVGIGCFSVIFIIIFWRGGGALGVFDFVLLVIFKIIWELYNKKIWVGKGLILRKTLENVSGCNEFVYFVSFVYLVYIFIYLVESRVG